MRPVDLVRLPVGEGDDWLGGPSPFREDFESFYRRERRSVIGLAYVLSGSRSAAEDLAQDAFLSAWVRRVVSNRAVSGFRRRTAEARALLRFGRVDYEVPELAEEAVVVWAAVRRLPKRQAQVIALRYLEGRAISDIARILDCSENTVNTHLKRAKTALSQQLEEETTDEHH